MAAVDERTLISSMVLQMVCEQVTLTLMDVEIDVDVQTFVNIAVVWALSELDIFDYGTLLDDRYTQPENAKFFNWKRKLFIGCQPHSIINNLNLTLRRHGSLSSKS